MSNENVIRFPRTFSALSAALAIVEASKEGDDVAKVVRSAMEVLVATSERLESELQSRAEATQSPFIDEVAEISEEAWKNLKPGPIQVVYPLDEEWNAALDAAAARVKPKEEPRPETSWEKGYWAGLSTAAHMVTLLKRERICSTSKREGS